MLIATTLVDPMRCTGAAKLVVGTEGRTEALAPKRTSMESNISKTARRIMLTGVLGAAGTNTTTRTNQPKLCLD